MEKSIGNLSSFRTEDGSLSIHSEYFKESFHDIGGAYKEALNKFLVPSELNRFKSSQKVNLLDICFGLGYNTACVLDNLKDSLK